MGRIHNSAPTVRLQGCRSDSELSPRPGNLCAFHVDAYLIHEVRGRGRASAKSMLLELQILDLGLCAFL